MEGELSLSTVLIVAQEIKKEKCLQSGPRGAVPSGWGAVPSGWGAGQDPMLSSGRQGCGGLASGSPAPQDALHPQAPHPPCAPLPLLPPSTAPPCGPRCPVSADSLFCI